MRTWQLFLIVVLLSVVLGFVLTFDGTNMWDDPAQYIHSLWLLSAFHLIDKPIDGVWMYGPLWEFILGFFTEFVFSFLRDPHWVRHALNFALFPITLFLVYKLLCRCGVSRGTAFLGMAALFGTIRFGGHALFNTKDFPSAAAYLLIAIYLWALLREGHISNGDNAYKPMKLILIGAIAVVPFLLRVPLITHFVFINVYFLFYFLFLARGLSVKRRIMLPLIPFISGCLVILLLYPPIWEWGFYDGLEKSFDHFSNYGLRGPTRLFYRKFPSTSPPWWYSFAWIPIITNPLVFIASMLGLLITFSGGKRLEHSFEIQTRIGVFHLSLQRWLWMFVVASWASVLILASTLYGAERQILFLYPLLFLLGMLGLGFLRERTKCVLAIILLASSTLSFIHWGRYSYVYKSPIIGNISTERFMGDYFGICLSQGVKALKGRVPSGSTVKMHGYLVPIAELQMKRLQGGLLSRDPDFGNYKFVGSWPQKRPFAVMDFLSIRSERNRILKDIDKGNAKLLWSVDMPPGEAACVLAIYPDKNLVAAAPD